MRCALGLVCFLVAAVPAAVSAQVESPQTRELRGQIEELQRRLDQLRRQEGRDKNITEIGSSRGRSRQDEEPRLVSRIYDLSDLFSIAPSYPALAPKDLQDTAAAIFPHTDFSVSGAGRAPSPTGMGGMGGGMFAVPSSIQPLPSEKTTLHQAAGAAGGTVSDSARTSVESLIHAITTTISPDQWDAVGGPSSIESLGAWLVVSAPVDVHDKITVLLDLFRKRWRSLRTINLQAHWLWLTANELTVALHGKDEPAYGALSDEAWLKIRELAAAHAADRPAYHATVTCYNGQTVSLQSGGQQIVVAGLTPVVGGGKEGAGYHPQVRIVDDGAVLQVTPIATRTAKYVVADVHSRVNRLSGPAEKLLARPERPLAGGDAAQVANAVDRPVLQSQRLETTLRLPVDRPTLIGGMTFAATGGAEPNLYLFLTAHVQELRDDEVEPTLPGGTEAKPASESSSKSKQSGAEGTTPDAIRP